MTINISLADVGQNLHPQITVLGVCCSVINAVNKIMNSNLEGVYFLIANTDAQALQSSSCNNKIQLGIKSTKGLGAGMRPDVGKIAAEEAINEIGSGDLLVVLGKVREEFQEIEGNKIPYSDLEIIKSFLWE